MFIYAHRGASAVAPENTLLAVQEALDQNADGIELDIHQLADEFVIIHDQWLHRTTNGTGHLSNVSLEQIKQLDAGQGQQVPTLGEVMALIKGGCVFNIEIKGVNNIEQLVDYVERYAQRYDFDDEQIVYSSFHHPLLAELKQYRPAARIGALTASIPLDYARFAQELGAESVNADVGFLNQAFVNDAKARGLKVFSFTVDQKEDLLRLKSWGVDGVFANHPGNAKKVVD